MDQTNSCEKSNVLNSHKVVRSLNYCQQIQYLLFTSDSEKSNLTLMSWGIEPAVFEKNLQNRSFEKLP